MARHAPLLVWDPNGEYAGSAAKDGIKNALVYTSFSRFVADQAAQPGHLGRVVLIERPAFFVPTVRYAHHCGGLTVVLEELHKYVHRREHLEALSDLLYTS